MENACVPAQIDDGIDAHIQAWYKASKPPSTCLLLLNVGHRVEDGKCSTGRMPKEWESNPSGTQPNGRVSLTCTDSKKLDWREIEGQLGLLGFYLEKCTPGLGESHGRCLFFSPQGCISRDSSTVELFLP